MDRAPYILTVNIDGGEIVKSRPLHEGEAERLAKVLGLTFPGWHCTKVEDRVGVHLTSTKRLMTTFAGH